VESDVLAEWGGQLEITALCAALHCAILVHSAAAPVVKMGEDSAAVVINLTFHRHYYALGEHYNTVQAL
jgi:OTU domain-containing protein 6